MKKRLLIALGLSALLLASCGEQLPSNEEATTYHVRYFYNYVEELSLDSDRIATGDSLYKMEEITVGSTLTLPTSPEREGYEFAGWSLDSANKKMWDNSTILGSESLTLYAKWERLAGHVEGKFYQNFEVTTPEKVVTSGEAFTLHKILGYPVVGGSVSLTNGAILRLRASNDDVKQYLDYTRLDTTTIDSAVFASNKVTVTYTNGGVTDTVVCNISDISLTKVLTDSSQENRASGYEEGSVNALPNQVMLAGSSSMQYWTSSTEDMDPIISYNHGIGGTTATHWNEKLVDRLVIPYHPRTVAYYVGVNDIINAGQNGTNTGNTVVSLLEKTHEYLPDALVFYVLINSLPGYARYQDQFDINNNIVTEFASTHDWAYVIDAGAGLMKENGTPNKAYFRTDGLHMSTYGYVIWGTTVKDAIYDTEVKVYGNK